MFSNTLNIDQTKVLFSTYLTEQSTEIKTMLHKLKSKVEKVSHNNNLGT